MRSLVRSESIRFNPERAARAFAKRYLNGKSIDDRGMHASGLFDMMNGRYVDVGFYKTSATFSAHLHVVSSISTIIPCSAILSDPISDDGMRTSELSVLELYKRMQDIACRRPTKYAALPKVIKSRPTADYQDVKWMQDVFRPCKRGVGQVAVLIDNVLSL